MPPEGESSRGTQSPVPSKSRSESSRKGEEQSRPESPETSRHPRLGKESSTVYGSITSPEIRPSDGAPNADSYQGGAAAGASASSSQQQRDDTPQQTPRTPNLRPKKPMMSRRASSKRPYRGQEFSVDDAPAELEIDVRQPPTSASSTLYGSLRRQPSSTLRRRVTQQNILPRLDSQDEDDPPTTNTQEEDFAPRGDETAQDDDEDDDIMDDDDDDISDAESFTLKDRQQAINETHPFGIRIWKPALYKKNRSVEKTAEGDIHSTPGGSVGNWLKLFNYVWTICFGWWLALAALCGALVCFACGLAPDAVAYGKVFYGLAVYLFYPFGQFVRLESDENYAEEDEGEGRSISEYERWQNGDIEHGRLFFGPVGNRSLVGRHRNSIDSADETDSLLGRGARSHTSEEDLTFTKNKRRLFGRGQWTLGRVIFFIFFYFFLAPMMLFVSLICWMLVFWIPMGRVTALLFSHLRRHPLALSFHSDASYSRRAGTSSSSILVCTYRAVGSKYWKYTIDGTNIFLINLLGIVVFTIVDYWVLAVALGIDNWLTHPGLIFTFALASVIPLAYFIGQAVASISAQSSMGVGAAINAFFSTLVEVYLYCVALGEGKAQLVEGSIIGSLFAGVLFLPGLSMCFGAIKRKTQRFNVKSAGVTSTMLLFAVIAAFGPTLFYQIYGSHELKCVPCDAGPNNDCRRCFFSQSVALDDDFFLSAVRPYTWFAAVLLFLAYFIGLWFTLRTHAAVIWSNESEEKKAPAQHNAHAHGANRQHHYASEGNSLNNSMHVPNHAAIRDTQLYKRILGQSLKQVGIYPIGEESQQNHKDDSHILNKDSSSPIPHIVPPKTSESDYAGNFKASSLPSLTEEENHDLVIQVAQMAATAATVAARDATREVRRSTSGGGGGGVSASGTLQKPPVTRTQTAREDGGESVVGADAGGPEAGGHDAPNWSKMKSAVILLVATVAYAVIAEVLVNTVDVVLESVDIDEKFLGITLFALVPNTTEFLNAISFAMNGNIALSMEIGSAYALQVCLLQIPALVFFSAISGRYLNPEELVTHTFNLLFPQWDMVTVILCVFLLSYVYGEGKSNYFKGSILVMTYLFVVMGFYFSGFDSMDSLIGVDSMDTLALGGRGGKGAWMITPKVEGGK